jgi:uncharacterized SAM-dependent methyltransferase
MSSHIIDVRLSDKVANGDVNIRDKVIQGLSRPVNQKILPELLLYDEDGLRIYDEITRVDDYYLFPAENNLLMKHADVIVRVMQGRHGDKDDQPIEGVVLELGAG